MPPSFQVDTMHSGGIAWDGGNLPSWSWQDQFTLLQTAPIVVQNEAFVIANFSIIALNVSTGAILWQQGTGHSWTGLAYDNGRVFANLSNANAAGDPVLYAFNAQTGAMLWRGAAINASPYGGGPVAAYGLVYLMSGYHLTAYSQTTGKRVWDSVARLIGGESTPAVGGGVVWVTGAGPQTYAFLAATGQPLWYYGTGNDTGGGNDTPIVYGGWLFATDSDVDDGNLAILNARFGTFSEPELVSTAPAFQANRGVRIDYFGYAIVCFDLQHFLPIWKAKLPTYTTLSIQDTAQYQPLIVGNTIYILGYSGALYAYDLNTGKFDGALPLGFNPAAGGGGVSLLGMAFSNSGVLLVPNGTTLVGINLIPSHRAGLPAAGTRPHLGAAPHSL